MTRSIKLVGAVSAGLAAAAVLCSPLASASPEDDFVSVITEKGISWPGSTPANMVEAGKGVCTDWSNGATFEQEVNSLTAHLSATDAAFFIGAATGAFCPEYESKVQ